MIACPKCQRQLPDWAQKCQFCGADTKAVVRPAPVKKERRPSVNDPKPWIWWVYYGICVFYVLNGAFSIVQGLGVLDPKQQSVITTAIGAYFVVIGLGLAARIEFIRGLMNVLSFINIIFALLGMYAGFMLIAVLGGFGFLIFAFQFMTFLTSVMMIFLLGETDKSAPNI